MCERGLEADISPLLRSPFVTVYFRVEFQLKRLAGRRDDFFPPVQEL